MTLTLVQLEASPEHSAHVRQALEEMIAESSTEDPELLRYELFESDDRPNVFVVQHDVDTVDERLHLMVGERFLELGTALRDELRAPIQVQHLRLVRSLHAS